MQTILEEALDITNGARRTDYGSVKESFKKIAEIASILCDKHITEIDVAKVMKTVKLVREIKTHKRDNLVDECGYARLESILQGDEIDTVNTKGGGGGYYELKELKGKHE